MSFFDPPPPPPEMPDFPPEPPTGRFVPGVAAIERVLARNEVAAIVLTAMHVYPDGLDIKLDSYLRDRETDLGGFALSAGAFSSAPMISSQVITSHVDVESFDDGENETEGPATEAALVSAPTFAARHMMPFPMRDHFGHGVNFGVQFPDGTKVTTLRPYVPDFDYINPTDDVPRYGLDGGGGGGTNDHYEHSYFLWPLPSAGILTMVCEWADVGIGETVVELDMDPILAATARVQVIWEEDAGLPSRRNMVAGVAAMRMHAEQLGLRDEPSP